MTVIYNMSIDRADKPWIGDRRFIERTSCHGPTVLHVLRASGQTRHWADPYVFYHTKLATLV